MDWIKIEEKLPKQEAPKGSTSFEHKARALTKEEVEQGRSNAYKYFDL